MRKRVVMSAVVVAALAAIGGGVAVAGSDAEGGATGAQADRAIAAALQATGGGSANAVERDNENGATWEVEVTKPGGPTVDVRLDESYRVVVIEGDTESPDGGDAAN